MSLKPVIAQLLSRLPELEWKISQLPPNTLAWRIPSGIFQLKPGSPYGKYVDEVKKNIKQLNHQTPSAQQFLAKQIERKLTLLIRLTVLQQQTSPKTAKRQILQHLRSRQQHLRELALQISNLEKQVAALHAQLKRTLQTQAKLNLNQDIGEANRQLTLLKEQHQRASSDNNNDSIP